ncbi:MAG: site-specific integrase [Pseudomonadota bacterium]|nr:site-specific integrase [Pseudomonadota bacterium]
MKDLTTELKKLEIETLDNLKLSKAKNTIRAYKSDFNDFALFCSKHSMKSMPTEPKIVSLYLTHLSKHSKYSTLKRRLASINVMHRYKGHYLDTKHPIIVENLLGIKRQIGVYQKAKKPLLFNDLKKIITVISESSISELKKLRDKTLILVGFSGGFRRSELVNIYKEDIEFVKEGVKIFVKKSKSDQSGEGMTKAIPSFKYIEYCPVDHLKKWMIKNKNNLVFPISDKNVALIIKRHALSAGLDEKKYAGHSLRSGFATTTAEFGASERNIMTMTGHKSVEMVRRYIKESDLFKNNALNKISNQ